MASRPIGVDGLGQRLLDRGEARPELVDDLATVDDERFLELVLHLQQFAQGAVGQRGEADEQRADLAHPGAWLARQPIDDVDQLPGRLGGGVVGQVPDLTGRSGMLAQHGQSLADVGNVGVRVRLVGIAEQTRGRPGEGRRHQPVTQVGLGTAARAEVVRGATDGHLDPSGLVCGEQITGHHAAKPALLGVRRVRAGLGERLPGRAAVHVDVLHADQPGPRRLGAGQHPGLEAGELLGPAGVRRVERLVDDSGAPAHLGAELRIGGVPADHLDVVGYPGRATAVDHPDRFAAPPEGVVRGEADGSGAEDHVPGWAVHDWSFAVGRAGRRRCSKTPDRAEKVTAPEAP